MPDATSTKPAPLVETAKANGVAYLSFLFERLPYLKTVEDFEAVLPWIVDLQARR